MVSVTSIMIDDDVRAQKQRIAVQLYVHAQLAALLDAVVDTWAAYCATGDLDEASDAATDARERFLRACVTAQVFHAAAIKRDAESDYWQSLAGCL